MTGKKEISVFNHFSTSLNLHVRPATPPPPAATTFPKAIFNIAALKDRLLATRLRCAKHTGLLCAELFSTKPKIDVKSCSLTNGVEFPLKAEVRRRFGELNISQSSPTTVEVMSLKGCRLACFHLQPEIPLERRFHIQLLKE